MPRNYSSQGNGNEKKKEQWNIRMEPDKTNTRQSKKNRTITKGERERERNGRKGAYPGPWSCVCVCVFISTRNPLPPRRRAGKKERNPARSQTNRILLQRGPLRIQHPSFVLFVFFLSISILECFQHWLAFGNRWLICVLLLLLILLVRLRFWFLVA